MSSGLTGSTSAGGRFQTPGGRADRLHWHATLERELPRLAVSDDLRQALLVARNIAADQWRGQPFEGISHAELTAQFVVPGRSTTLAPGGTVVELPVVTEDVTGEIDVEWLVEGGRHLPRPVLDPSSEPVWAVLRTWWADMVNLLRSRRPESVARDTTLTVYADYAADRLDLELRCWHGVIEVMEPLGLADEYAERDL